MNKYVDMWKRYYNKLIGGGVTFVRQSFKNVPRHIVEARRAANRRARVSRRINRFMAKGKHL